MDLDAKQRLYDKIKGKYNFPETVDGVNVNEALSFQCASLYKHWRFRLKELHFRGKSIAEALDNKPSNIHKDQWTWLVCEYWNSDKQKHISEVNTINKLNTNETPANGSRSTARVFYDLVVIVCLMSHLFNKIKILKDHPTQLKPNKILCISDYLRKLKSIKQLDGNQKLIRHMKNSKNSMQVKLRSMVKIHLVCKLPTWRFLTTSQDMLKDLVLEHDQSITKEK